MNRIFAFAIVILQISSCGSASGVMNGVGEVLNGMALDAQSPGSLFK